MIREEIIAKVKENIFQNDLPPLKAFVERVIREEDGPAK